jgi:hypothetical protein
MPTGAATIPFRNKKEQAHFRGFRECAFVLQQSAIQKIPIGLVLQTSKHLHLALLGGSFSLACGEPAPSGREPLATGESSEHLREE